MTNPALPGFIVARARSYTTTWDTIPPDENPQPWATFREAIEFASTADCSHAKGAWIIVGEQIFNPVDVFEAYQTLNR